MSKESQKRVRAAYQSHVVWQWTNRHILWNSNVEMSDEKLKQSIISLSSKLLPDDLKLESEAYLMKTKTETLKTTTLSLGRAYLRSKNDEWCEYLSNLIRYFMLIMSISCLSKSCLVLHSNTMNTAMRIRLHTIILFVCNRGDTLNCQDGLLTRKLMPIPKKYHHFFHFDYQIPCYRFDNLFAVLWLFREKDIYPIFSFEKL